MNIIEKRIIAPENEIVSTLECPNITTMRADGNTTRQIDFAVQQLFKKNIVKAEDHARLGIKPDKRLFELILDRLNREFKSLQYYFIYDTKQLLIKLEFYE